MHYMTFSVDHDIAVVSVLDLQNIAGHRVRRHRLDEIQTGSLELYRVLATVLGDKEVEKIVDLCTPHLVSRRGIRYDINDTTLYNMSYVGRRQVIKDLPQAQ